MKCQSCSERFAAGEGVEDAGVFYCWVCLPGRAKLSHALNVCAELKAQRAAQVVAVVEAKPAAPVEPQAQRVCRVREMRGAFRAAQSAGLDTSNGPKMRARLAKYLGRKVLVSRRDIARAEWMEISAGIEMGVLSW